MQCSNQHRAWGVLPIHAYTVQDLRQVTTTRASSPLSAYLPAAQDPRRPLLLLIDHWQVDLEMISDAWKVCHDPIRLNE